MTQWRRAKATAAAGALAAMLLLGGRRFAAAVAGNAGWVLLLHAQAGGADATRAGAALVWSQELRPSPETLRGEAVADAASGRTQAAQRALEEALASRHGDPLLLAAEATALRSQGDLNGAAAALAAAYEQTAAAWPRSATGAVRLRGQLAARLRAAGWQQLQAGALDDAQVSLGGALALNASDAETVFDQGLLADARGDWTAAVERYRAAVALGFDDADLHFRLGNDEWQHLNDEQTAFQEFLRVHTLDPGFSVQLYLDLASIDEDLGQVAEAERWLTLGATLFPGAAGPSRELARLHGPH